MMCCWIMTMSQIVQMRHGPCVAVILAISAFRLQVHLFHITENDTRLTWMSKDNRNRSISIKDVKNVRWHLTASFDMFATNQQ